MKPPTGKVMLWKQCIAERIPDQLKALLRSSDNFLADADRAQLMAVRMLCERRLSRLEKRKIHSRRH